MSGETVIRGLESRELSLPGLRVLRSAAKSDVRGAIASVYNRDHFASLGIHDVFVQENHCVTLAGGTVRGFHFQRLPYGQSKLIRVLQGRILDVNVDLRRGSPTYGRHEKTELSPDAWDQIYVPIGFAHCYLTLDDNAVVLFKLGCAYAPAYADGLAWNDPDLGIDWPIASEEALALPRDLDRPRFSQLPPLFYHPQAAS